MLPWMTVGWTLLVAVADPDVIAAVAAVGCCSAVCCCFFFYLSCFEWSMKDFLAVNCPLTNQYELNLNMNRNVNET